MMYGDPQQHHNQQLPQPPGPPMMRQRSASSSALNAPKFHHLSSNPPYDGRADNFLMCTLCVIRAAVAFLPMFTLFMITETTSSPFTFCILHFLSLLCVFECSRRHLHRFSECLSKTAKRIFSYSSPLLKVSEHPSNIAKRRPHKFVLVPYPRNTKAITQAEDRTMRRARRHHPRAVRKHDIRSHGWRIMAQLIRCWTSRVLAADFCPKKEVGSWVLVDRPSGVVIAEKVVVSSLSSSALRVRYKGSVKRNDHSTSRRGNSISDEEEDDGVRADTVPPPPQTPPLPTPRATPYVQPPAIPTPRVQPPAIPTPQVQPPAPTPQVQPPAPSPPAPPPQAQPPAPSPPAPTPQVQPPAPSTPPSPPPTPPQAVGWFNFNFTRWFNLDVAGLAQLFLVMGAGLVVASPQILGSNSFAAKDKTLLFLTQICGSMGFILCLLGYIVRRECVAAKLLVVSGVIANICGILLVIPVGKKI